MSKRFSEIFNIRKSQAELDFVDIPLDTDILLFVDPFGFSIEADRWFAESNNLIVDYFQLLIEKIRSSQRDQSLHLLSHLHEPNDTHLGFSRSISRGRGFGHKQSIQLFRKLSESKAVKTGRISDLSDCELVIPGISSDKISDMTINIVKGKLVDYTTTQCKQLNIPTRTVPTGPFWDGNIRQWKNGYGDLPIYNEQRILLVPKAAVRFHIAADHQEYYNHFVLNYLQAEFLSAGEALVHVLKNGKKKVYKKDVKNRYPCTKNYLFEFSEKHPNVLMQYKTHLRTKSRPLNDEEIEIQQSSPKEIDFQKLISELERIPIGKENASVYHDHIFGVLQAIFYPSLRYPRKEEIIHEGRKRIDIVFNNGDKAGFFFSLSSVHRIFCPYILFECKNIHSDPRNTELDQLVGRFSDKRGRFGFQVCRKLKNQKLTLKHCKDIMNDNSGYIVVLEDNDIIHLLKLRAKKEFSKIHEYMHDKIRELVFEP